MCSHIWKTTPSCSLIYAKGWQTMARRSDLAICLFLYSPRAKNGYYIFRWLKKKQKKNSSCHVKITWNLFKFHPCRMFCWSTAMSIHLYIVYSCFCNTIIELGICDRDWPGRPKIFTVWLIIEKFAWNTPHILKLNIHLETEVQRFVYF